MDLRWENALLFFVVGEVRCPLKIQSWQYFESRLVVIAYKRILNFSALQIIKYFMLLVCKYFFHYSLYSFIKKMKINYSLYSYKEESLQECGLLGKKKKRKRRKTKREKEPVRCPGLMFHLASYLSYQIPRLLYETVNCSAIFIYHRLL